MTSPENAPVRRRVMGSGILTPFMARCIAWSVPVFFACIFFAISLAPSLLPRPAVVQGLISGISLAMGYALGVIGVWLWHYLRLPVVAVVWQRRLGMGCASIGGLILVIFLRKSAEWQNTVRDLMGMEPEATTGWVLLVSVSGGMFLLLMLAGKFFCRVFRIFASFLHRFLPPRVSHSIGLALTVVLFWSAVDGILLRSLMRVADRSFQQLDAMMEPEVSAPKRFTDTAESLSLLDWKDLGRQGRLFVSSAPSAVEMNQFFGHATPTPIRVYVGLNSAPDVASRAELALRELIRMGGFDRAILVLATPTGTGWIDPGAISTVEYLHRGNIATVAVQYSYLNSPLALLTEAEYGAEMARALFSKVYGYWISLPRDSRPRLFLHGLSLGALHSDLSFNLFDIIDDPFDGALWSGPPFRSKTWRMTTAQRDPGTPAWLPVFRNGNVVRFANQDGFAPSAGAWGNFRLVFLQYASDPITFFDPGMLWREPAWMQQPRGPDVTPDMGWFPVVTALQVAADMVVGTAPMGFGHEIAPTDYLDAWFALTEPKNWEPDELQRLRQHITSKKAPGQ